MAKIVSLPREERKTQILQMARAVVDASPRKPVTTCNREHPYQITAKTHWTAGDMARWLDLAPTTRFRDMLYELVDANCLRLVIVPYRAKGLVRERSVFCLPEHFQEQIMIDF